MSEKKDEYEDIPVNLPLEAWGILALQAHERDMKLNDYLVQVIIERADAVIAEAEQQEGGP